MILLSGIPSELRVPCTLGLSTAHLVEVAPGQHLTAATASAFSRLSQRAAAAGFELAVVSGWRSYHRQLQLFNGKAMGTRPVTDDAGVSLDPAQFTPEEWLQRILRFSALPGTSRHHWGSDLDVCDRRALPQGYRLQLTPQEYGEGGVQVEFAGWLAQRVAADDAEGFFLPYETDRGGVAPEPWHLSHRSSAAECAACLTCEHVLPLWRGSDDMPTLAFHDVIEAQLTHWWPRFVVLD